MELEILEELRSELPPLHEDEFAQLEALLVKEGIRDRLRVWRRDGKNILVDGHNRYEIAKKHNLPFDVAFEEFADIEEVKFKMRSWNTARRNLTDGWKAELALRNKAYLLKKGREKMQVTKQKEEVVKKAKGMSFNDIPYENVNSDAKREPEHSTRKEIAEDLAWSTGKVAQAEYVRKNNPENWQKTKDGEYSVGRAYAETKKEEKKREKEEEKERIKLEVIKKVEKAGVHSENIILGDAIEELMKLEPESVDLIVIDPPYFEITQEKWDRQWKTELEYLEWSKEWIAESYRVLAPHGSFYIWGGVGEKSSAFLKQKFLLDDAGFYFKDWITWKKRRGLGNRRGWLYTREECLWFVKDNAKFIWNEEAQYSDEPNQFTHGFDGHEVKSEFKRITNVWSDIPEQLGNKKNLHYTPKPVKAIERMILANTYEGQIVLDFFAGSGTTGEAAKNTKRNFILIEKDPDYTKFIERRLLVETV